MAINNAESINRERFVRSERRLRAFLLDNPRMSSYKRNELAEIAQELRQGVEGMFGLVWDSQRMEWVGL